MDIESLIQSKHFCVLPFVRQTLWYDGQYRVCCYEGGTAIETHDDNVESFNSQQLKEIRQSFLSGKFPSICQVCVNAVENNVTSMAEKETQHWITNDVLKPALIKNINKSINNETLLPQLLDIRYSNVCNLKCRTCNGGNSSAIQAEYNRLSDTVDSHEKIGYVASIKRKENHRFPQTDDQLFSIYFAGGEPLIEEYNLKFLESFDRTDVEIVINTNLSVLNERIIKLLAKFSKIQLMVSIDAYGQLNNYIRNGSDWNILVDHLNTLKNYPAIKVGVGSVLNIYNVFDMPRLVDFLAESFPEYTHGIYPIIVEKELFLECLPPELRAEAIQALESIRLTDSNRSTVQEAINTLKSNNFDSQGFENFIKYAKIFDKARNEKLTDIVPQFAPYYDQDNSST